MRIGWCLVLAGCGAAASEEARYLIDASTGRFTARIASGGLLSGLGHPHTAAIRDFSGEARLAPGGLEGGTIQLGIRADSVAEIGEKFGEDERKEIDREVHAKVLEVSKYPRIDFQGRAVSAIPLGENRFQVRIEGKLTLHGVTRSLGFPAEVAVRDGTLTARGGFTIKHSDYGLRRLSAVGGLVRADDEIVFSFDLLGRGISRAP